MTEFRDHIARPASFITGVRRIERTPSAHGGPLLIKLLLQSAMAHAPDQEIVYRDTVRHSYRDFNRRVAQLANVLTDLGVTPGQTVGVLDWDSHRYLESYFAVPGIGAVLHMVNVRLSPEQILFTINHARDDVLLVHADFLPLIESLWDRLETVGTLILLADAGASPVTALPSAGEYEELITAASPSFLFPDFDEDACATTFYTTGTTGLPKGVSFSHRQLVLHSLAAATALGSAADQGRLHRGDVYMPITPMFHVHAWGLPFVATMLGLKQVYPGRYEAETLLMLRRKEGVTFSHCVPTLLQMLLSCPDSSETDLGGWKIVIGGSALSAGLARTAIERGIDIFTGYGMSETCPILSLAQLGTDMMEEGLAAQIAARTKAGRPVPLVELAIIDESCNSLPHDGEQSGEIVARAPWLTQAYVGDAAASERLWATGYLHTGDVGMIDPDGWLRITDRMKDVIKSGGEWVSSLEIEDLISQHCDVREVAVIGIPDARWGERPLALIVAASEASSAITSEAIAAHLQPYCAQGIISKWAIPEVIQVDALAKTSVGKLDKKTLRARFGQL